MKRILKYGLITAFLSSYVSAKDICYAYSANSFKAYKSDSKQEDKSVKPIESVIVKLPKPINKLDKNSDTITVSVKVASKVYNNRWIMSYRNDDDIYQLGGECDSGQLVLDKYMNMRFWFVSFEKENNNLSEPEIALELYAKDKTRWITGVKIECPKEKKATKPTHNLFVCYKSKTVQNSKVKYNGCQRVNNPCSSLGLEHFGHYLNSKNASAALKRCQESKPKN